MPGAKTSFCDDFNRTAQAYVNGSVTADLLMAKYSILMSHKAEQPEDRRALVEVLYTQGLRWMQAQCGPDIHATENTVAATTALLSRLTEPDSFPFLPRAAPVHLADAGLALLLAAEAPRKNKYDNQTSPCLVKVAEQALAFADKIKAGQAALPPEPAPKKKDELLSL